MLMPPTSSALAARPVMPTQEDEDRSLHQRARLSILEENWDELLSMWMEGRVDPERLAAWGLPDTSSNILADICRQLTSPGLYGAFWNVGHADPANQALVGAGGFLERSGYLTFMQRVQYLTTGMGDWFVRHDIDNGQLTHRPVSPANVFIIADPNQADRAVGLWELRVRHLAAPFNKWVYAWDRFDLGHVIRTPEGEVIVRPPSCNVVVASGDNTGLDVSNLCLSTSTRDATNGLVGERYVHRYEDGEAFIPYTWYRSIDSKQTWNHHDKRGAHRGTLNAATHETYASHCAKDASGRTVIISGLRPVGANVKDGGTPEKVRSIQLQPGTMVYHEQDGDAQPFVQEVGPGANVGEVQAYADNYERKQLRRWGIDSAGAEKGASDPTSGASKFVSRQNKREFADQVRPLYVRADQDAIRKCAALLRLAGVATFAETGYSVTHAAIALSGGEREELRTQTDWELAKGQISEVEAYKRIHGGTTEDAVAALTRAAVEKAQLAAGVRDALKVAGFDSAPPVADLDVGTMVAAVGIVKDAAAELLPIESAQQSLVALAKISGDSAAAILAPVSAWLAAKKSSPKPGAADATADAA